MTSKLAPKFLLVAALILFAGIFSSISLVNHYNFRTYAWDLGLFNNAIYDYSHFRFNDCMLLLPAHDHFKNYLADHFSVFPMLISPFVWLGGSYTLLIVQVLAILAGGLGIYKLIQLKFPDNKYLPLLATIHFFTIWGIYSALSFDYHDNVVAAMLVPWFIFFFSRKKYFAATFFWVLVLLCKENMALWAAFITIGLGIMFRKDRSQLKYASLYTFFAVVYFFAVIKIVMPSLNVEQGKQYFHFNFDALGKDFPDAFFTIVSRPIYAAKILFVNHTGNNEADHLKLKLHLLILLSGGFFLLYKPPFLVMLIPIYAQKLYNNDWPKWGPSAQYSIEFVPILTLAIFYSIGQLHSKIQSIIISFFCICLSILATKMVYDGYGDIYLERDRLHFLDPSHYERSFNVQGAHKILELIPDDARVSASSALVPHLAFHEYIYQFPYLGDSNYIVLLNDGNKYPLGNESFQSELDNIIKSHEWKLIVDRNKIFVFSKLER